jgi:hypothetical protein
LLMTPDRGNPRNLRNPGNLRMGSRPMHPLQTSIEKSTLGSLCMVTFKDFPERAYKGSQMTQTEPKKLQGRPKAAQMHDQGTKGAPSRPRRSSQRRRMAPQREFKGELYKQKLPTNRTNGPYVKVSQRHVGHPVTNN